MLDFFEPRIRKNKNEGTVIYPDYQVHHSDDLMVRGGKFYAIWDENAQMWQQDPYVARALIDAELRAYAREVKGGDEDDKSITIAVCESAKTGSWREFQRYISDLPDSYVTLNERIVFSNTETDRESYASVRLNYPLIESPCEAYNEMMSVLYEPEERDKLEWAVGSIISGDAVKLQKFIVLYGDPGGGKSTVLDIITGMFKPYVASFDAKALGSANASFSMEPFRTNPLIAIQHDGDLSRLEDNTRLNSIVSHETMPMNEKFKSSYDYAVKAFLFMGTNKPVRISDAKSGILRRLIDVTPSGRHIPVTRYFQLKKAIEYEYSGIAWHCLEVYKKLGPHYYSDYQAESMMAETNSFYNFVEENFTIFKKSDLEDGGIALNQAWDMYKHYCEDSSMDYKLPKHKFRAELANYFRTQTDSKRIGGKQARNVYSDFLVNKFSIGRLGDSSENTEEPMKAEEYEPMKLILTSKTSEIDTMLADLPAQYASSGKNEVPLRSWDEVTTTLKELDTTKVHYIFFPDEFKNHIVVDFDLKDESGHKSAERNLEEAAKWPATYAEFSKGGAGIHLHYIYDGDPSTLSALYAPGIEIKVFNGKSSLRRRLTYCNDRPVAHISSGLPLKEKKKMVDFNRIASEKGLRAMIERNLRKEIVPATKPSIDFIYNDLERAYADGMVYDVRDMRPKILAFAARSSHQSDYCIKLVGKMKFYGENVGDCSNGSEEEPLVVYDIEVYKNLLLICWKQLGEGHEVVKMFNPTPQEVERLFHFRLISFNGTNYDSQILYARYLGWDNMKIYELSRKLISTPKNEVWKYKFKEARNIEYVDVFDFASKKQSLKKWQIELRIHHQESEPDWDEPLPENKWEECAEYCANDVRSTDILFNHLQGEFTAREILADIAGMPLNTSTNNLVAKILFGNDRHPNLVYTDLRNGEQWMEERKWYFGLPTE